MPLGRKNAAERAMVVMSQGRVPRTVRNPVHPFQLKRVPFVIQPFLLAPVLAGETMKNLRLQTRVVSDPIKNPLIGWWNEIFIFYVKLRDLAERDDLVEMVLDPNWDVTPVTTAQGGTAADTLKYYAGGAGMIKWSELCLRRVIQEYFRDEGETYTDHTITDGVAQPVASIVGNNAMDSMFQRADFDAQDVPVVDGSDADATLEASEVELAMRKWDMLRFNNLTEMSFEDYLETFGIRPTMIEQHKPELLRYARDWTYPTNTIDPANGTPRSAVSWAMSVRADKNRFFTEPGFIFGVTTTRPKVYLRNLKGSIAETMNDLYTWLPALLTNDPRASLKMLTDNIGPVPGSTDTTGYVIDIRDLFLYGDQFVNFATTDTDKNMVPLPDATLANKRYVPTLAAVQELFVTGATAYYIREDGVAQMSIATSQRDQTPRGGPVNVA